MVDLISFEVPDDQPSLISIIDKPVFDEILAESPIFDAIIDSLQPINPDDWPPVSNGGCDEWYRFSYEICQCVPLL